MYKSVKPATFTLPLTLLEDLDSLAKDIGKKKTAIVSEALEMYMDYYDIKEAQKCLDDKKDKTIPADEFFDTLG
ncbi:MAG: hypothetical protein U9N49_08695 [Campylobacterota bacterium]|nr:hypothetical protein [Campylobacterota bacterium]